MSVQSWQIGDVKVTKIVEGSGTIQFPFIVEATPEVLLPMKWLQPHFLTEDGQMIFSFHALLVETPTLKIVVDTCHGNDKERGGIPDMHMRSGPFLEDFERNACKREEVDVVLCTHMHVDHVGWNTMLVDGQWIPTFPNARYLFARPEYEHWSREASIDPRNEEEAFKKMIERGLFNDSVLPVMEAGLADLVETNHVVCPEVRLIPTHGHSPGHVSVEINSAGQQAFITGDIMHHPSQLAHPEWHAGFDNDPAMGVVTRKKFCGEVTDTDALVIGTHWPTPTAGHVVSDGAAYRLKY